MPIKHDIRLDDLEKLHQAKRFIEQHFLEDMTLALLCREVALNEFKLKRGFRLLFGTSAIQYVRQLRMEYAQTLLRSSSALIEEVSTRVGYRYPNHFSTAYKKHFGMLPSQRYSSPADGRETRLF